ncbi:MAG TPA: trypsin-like serine protease, partial [Azospirillaceae bacterium]|nr:trypsin-like serine protease [Azospirillaceae bacterium]
MGKAWRLAVAAMGLLLVMAAPAGAQAPRLQGIQGQDDRKPLDSQEWPWSAMGRVNQASRRTLGHCTGTLVAPKVVLTAAHCLYNSALHRPAKPHEVHFLAGYRRGEALATA